MNAGRLDREISIYRMVQTIGEFKDKILIKELVDTVRAGKRFINGSESLVRNEMSSSRVLVFTIRFRTDIKTDYIIEYDGLFYDIISPPEELGRREGLNIRVKTSKNFK